MQQPANEGAKARLDLGDAVNDERLSMATLQRKLRHVEDAILRQEVRNDRNDIEIKELKEQIKLQGQDFAATKALLHQSLSNDTKILMAIEARTLKGLMLRIGAALATIGGVVATYFRGRW